MVVASPTVKVFAIGRVGDAECIQRTAHSAGRRTRHCGRLDGQEPPTCCARHADEPDGPAYVLTSGDAPAAAGLLMKNTWSQLSQLTWMPCRL